MSTSGDYPVSDLQYDVIITMSNLLQGMDSLSTYQRDAEKNGDDELVRVFGEIHASYREGAVKLREQLARLAR